MKYFIFQGNDHDCGFAALKMYLALIAKDKSYLYIPKPSKREYFNLQDLAKIAKMYDVNLESYGCSKDYIDSLEVPSMTLIDENHVVLVVKRTKKYLVLYDPSQGKVKMREDEFLRRWRNVFIIAKEPESISPIRKLRQHLFPAKLDLLSAFTALFSAAILICSFYLLNKRENFWFSLVFLLLFISGQIIEKLLLYRQVYTFDKTYMPSYFENKRNCSKDGYVKYVDYKKIFFTYNRQLISTILIAFLITFLLCFNDFRNVFVLLSLILIKLLEIILFSKFEQNSKNKIAEIENRMFLNKEDSKELALKANLMADGHIFITSIKDLFYIFVTFVFSILMMFITNNIGCNFVIFHFVMYYTGFISYNQMLESLSSRKENRKLERRFFDACNL